MSKRSQRRAMVIGISMVMAGVIIAAEISSATKTPKIATPPTPAELYRVDMDCEKELHALTLTDVNYRNADMMALVADLQKLLDENGVKAKISITIGNVDPGTPPLTLNAERISVLEVLRFITNATDYQYSIFKGKENKKIMLYARQFRVQQIIKQLNESKHNKTDAGAGK